MWCLSMHLRHLYMVWIKTNEIQSFWCKTCFLAAILVTFKKLEAGWLFNLQHGDSLSLCLSVCLSVSPSPSPSPSLSLDRELFKKAGAI